MVLPSLLVISQGWGLIDLPLRATFSPAHPLARRDVPLARARGVHDRALREPRRSTGPIPSVLQARNRQAPVVPLPILLRGCFRTSAATSGFPCSFKACSTIRIALNGSVR